MLSFIILEAGNFLFKLFNLNTLSTSYMNPRISNHYSFAKGKKCTQFSIVCIHVHEQISKIQAASLSIEIGMKV